MDSSYFPTRFLKSQTAIDVLAADDFRLQGSPYPGLRSFSPQEGNVFFGRDQSVNKIRGRLADLHVAVVLGGSGSGKSSVVRAGLIPRLNSTKGIRGRSGNWYAAEFRPRLRPMDELADALADLVYEQFPNQAPGFEGRLGEPDRKATLARLKNSFGRHARSISPTEREFQAAKLCDVLFDFVATELDQRDRTATKGLRSGRPNLLLVVDQFEEIFRPEVAGEPSSGGPQLLDLLLATYSRLEFEQRGPSEARTGLFVVLTMRSEELHRCTEHPSLHSTFGAEKVQRSLADMVNRSAYLLDLFDPIQDRGALREAIIYPARRMFQDWGLPLNTSNPDSPFCAGVPDWLIRGAERLNRELEHRPDQLPLLQHALQTMWRRAVTDWASVTKQHDFLIQREHLVGGSIDATLLANGPDLSACLDERANDAAREAITAGGDALSPASACESNKQLSIHDTQLSPGGVATRAAFRALAQRDDRGHWVRRFASLQQIMGFMQVDTVGWSNNDKETCLRTALGVFVSRSYLVEKDGQYDISHEALIRNWKVYQEWLRQPEEVAQTITRLVTDVDPVAIELASGDSKRQLLLSNFPAPVRDRLGAIFRSQVLPLDWAKEQIIPLVKRPTLANRWASATSRMATNERNDDKIVAGDVLDRLRHFVEQTEQAQNQIDQQLKHQRRFKIGAVAVLLVTVLAVGGGIIVQSYANQRAFVERLLTFAKLDSSPNFRQRILVLLHALEESKGAGRFFTDPKFARDALRNLLVRAPKLGGTYEAIGFNASGTKLVILHRSELTVHDLTNQTSASPLAVSWPPRKNSSDAAGSYRSSTFEPYVTGFIDDPEKKEIPAVYYDGVVMFWHDQEVHSFDVRHLLPTAFANVNFRNIELMRTIRFTVNAPSDRGAFRDTFFFALALTRDENGHLALKRSPPGVSTSVTSSGVRFAPTIAMHCDLYGYLETQTLFIGQLGREPVLKADLGTSVQDDTPGSSFVRSVSFSADCSTVTIRYSSDRLRVISIEAENDNVRLTEANSIEVIVPEAARDVVQPLFVRNRPLVASSRIDQGHRFAWLTRNGIVVIDAASVDGKDKLLFGGPILTGLDNGVKLQFSRDGKFLILVHQKWGANPEAKVRVWEISEALDRIPSDGTELNVEACRIARIEDGRAALERSESIQWFGKNRASPCEAVVEKSTAGEQ